MPKITSIRSLSTGNIVSALEHAPQCFFHAVEIGRKLAAEFGVDGGRDEEVDVVEQIHISHHGLHDFTHRLLQETVASNDQDDGHGGIGQETDQVHNCYH